MNIDKAIEIKLQWRKDNYPPALPDEMNADMLSIEALKLLQKLRGYSMTQVDTRLPGEEADNLAEFFQRLVFDLEGWDYIAPAECGGDIYTKDNERVLIDRATGRLITRYTRMTGDIPEGILTDRAIHDALGLVYQQLEWDRTQSPAISSPAEGLGMMWHVFNQLKKEVFLQPRDRSVPRMYQESIQLAATAVRFMVDVCTTREVIT